MVERSSAVWAPAPAVENGKRNRRRQGPGAPRGGSKTIHERKAIGGHVQNAARLAANSGTVIRMFNQNRDRPVNLLGEHDADQAMRPGHRRRKTA